MSETAADRARPAAPETHRARRRSAFTLIEIIAVVAIIGMIMGLGVPMLGGSRFDPLRNEADEIADRLRFARQRAVMTGVPHRLLIDLEEGGYLIEWFVDENRAFGRATEEDPAALLFSGPFPGADTLDEPVLEFTPPVRSDLDYHPIPHREMGSFRWLDDDLYFVGVDGPSGWVESGDFAIVFFVDGTTAPLRLEIANGEDERLTLEVEALLDRVRVFEGGARS